MKDIVIAGFSRSPFHFAKKGSLAEIRPDDLAATVIKDLLKKLRINQNEIEDVILGCAFPEGEQGYNLARIVGLLAGIPISVPGTTVNRFCGSSMQAIHMAAGAIQMNAGEVFICGGVESMSRIPMDGFNLSPNPQLCKSMPSAYISMGETAENIAKEYKISRKEQEIFALSSQEKAASANSKGYFIPEITSINLPHHPVNTDGCIRPTTNLEKLAALPLAFDDNGTITAGTASPLTDGAAAILICSSEYAEKNEITPLAKIISCSVSGCDPKTMGLGPIESSKKALSRAGIKSHDLDLIELNEAFASQAIACIRDLKLNPDIVNIDGGAIAIGHPLGASGARITGKAASLLQRKGGNYALATQCIGGGQGIATVLQAI